MIVITPESLRPIANFKYPPYIQNYFEEWFYNYFSEHGLKTERIYLPIFWTTYYLTQGHKPSPEIQSFLDSLDKTKKYFTIVQYDDGILENVSGLDLLVFSSAGRGNVTIPLYADGLDHIKPIPFEEKPILCSMIASNTHPIRKRIYDALKDVEGFYIKLDEKHDWETYIDIVNKSKFVIAPRGYGLHSFRFWEAIKLGCYPIFISDNHDSNWNITASLGLFHNHKYSFLNENEVDFIKTEINNVLNYIKKINRIDITYESIYTHIIYSLNAEHLYAK